MKKRKAATKVKTKKKTLSKKRTTRAVKASKTITKTRQKKIPLGLIKSLVEIYYDFQQQRIATQLRIGMAVKEKQITKDDISTYGIQTLFDNALIFEKDIKGMITKEVEGFPINNTYLSKIQGVGPIMAAGLIANIQDISKFEHISSLWQYAGYGMNRYCPECKKPTYVEVKYKTKTAKKLTSMDKCPLCGGETEPTLQRRTTGYQSNWNSKLKTLLWLIGTSFVKQPAAKSQYRKLYEKFKKEEHRKHKRTKIDGKIKYNDGHLHNRAMRRVVKIFMAHLWTHWREMEGLEVSLPYSERHLGHDSIPKKTDKP